MIKMEHVLVATDFSSCAQAALQQAVSLAKKLNGRITLLHVFDLPLPYTSDPSLRDYPQMVQWLQDFKKDQEKKLQAAAEKARQEGVDVAPLFKEGSPSSDIVPVAEEIKADLIVIGTQGRTGLPRFLMGSVAESVSRSAPCPVLVVRDKENEASSEIEKGKIT